MQTISKDSPLVEVTLRRYEKPSANDRDLVRKLCLSTGLLQPGDSRDVVVDVLYVLLGAFKEKKEMNSEEVRDSVIQLRKRFNLPILGVASSNIRRQLKRLRDMYLVEKNVNNYRITEFAFLTETFEEKVERFLLSQVLSRVKEYYKEVDEK
ncbi:hypothetical protein KY337_02645, partial [Candidatus Woesearchaeota archaeon]|nr:hypothetical protein [Candidatus Woesearchaeota archaeon]